MTTTFSSVVAVLSVVVSVRIVMNEVPRVLSECGRMAVQNQYTGSYLKRQSHQVVGSSASAHRSDERRGHALEGQTGSIVPGDDHTEGFCAWRELRQVGAVRFTRRQRQLSEKRELAAHDRRAHVRGAAAHVNPQGILDGRRRNGRERGL